MDRKINPEVLILISYLTKFLSVSKGITDRFGWYLLIPPKIRLSHRWEICLDTKRESDKSAW
jgi:hypothetical protein